MLDLLIQFIRNKLCHNWSLKNIFETTLRCTIGKVHESILTITRRDLELPAACNMKRLMTIVHNFQ